MKKLIIWTLIIIMAIFLILVGLVFYTSSQLKVPDAQKSSFNLEQTHLNNSCPLFDRKLSV
ncbi:hypothetical protein C1I60_17230 [Paenibacillus terrae]|uniref:Uncharacterized protein n=1 Tax=Paenibacillus terrae TaxID=159743 RepID=A0A4U2PZ19_9BACL|nr:hypothetical protein C1I60_17230 [Paenibacillus terrae]